MATKDQQRKADAKRAGKRSQNWACIIYPDSAPPYWREHLEEAHIKTLISPLHNMDTTATGEVKKAHYHVLAMFDSPTSEMIAKDYFARAGYTAPPELVRSATGYARYLIHLDDHDKYRYDDADVVGIAGASWATTALDGADLINATLDEIEDYIDMVNCTSYYLLCRYARHERPDWVHTIRTHTIHITALCKSLAWGNNNKCKDPFPRSTGSGDPAKGQ